MDFTIEQIYDISMQISSDMFIYPGDLPPEISIQQDYDMSGFRVSELVLGSHTGTHVDAQKHFFKEGLSIDETPLSSFMGPCRLIEASPGKINKETIPSDIGSGEIILFKTNKSLQEKSSKNDNYKKGGLYPSVDTHLIQSCFLEIDTARLLLSYGVKAIGVDGLSIESPIGDGSVHRLLLSKSIAIIEGLKLCEVPPGQYLFICLPLKIKDCDGAPARAVLIK